MLQGPVAPELRSFRSLSRVQQASFRRQSVAPGFRRPSSTQLSPTTSSALLTARTSVPFGGGGPDDSVVGSAGGTRTKTVSLSLDTSPISPWSIDLEAGETIEEEEEEEELPYPGFSEKAFLWFGQTTIPRNLCLKAVNDMWFDRLTMMVILINCFTLGMYKPCEDSESCVSVRCRTLAVVDHVIFGYFAVEMVIKMLALGVFGKTAYLADTWNRLDCFIVVAGVTEYMLQEYLGGINLTAIRTIRVLRPLRAVNRIPSMRILVNLLLDTLPMLGNVLLLCFFVFFIFGIVGVQLWNGLLRNRCAIELPLTNFSSFNTSGITLNRYYIPEETSMEYICSQPNDAGQHKCADLPQTKYKGHKCNGSLENYATPGYFPDNDSCLNWNQYYTNCTVMERNPFQGSISFDNIGFAWVAIFLVISLEGWTDIMYYLQDAHSFWNWMYFVVLIVIGAFFMINLCLVVIATQFAETKRRETERMIAERARYQSTSTLSTSEQEGGGDGVYAAIVKYIAHLGRRAKRKIMQIIAIVRKRHELSNRVEEEEDGALEQNAQNIETEALQKPKAQKHKRSKKKRKKKRHSKVSQDNTSYLAPLSPTAVTISEASTSPDLDSNRQRFHSLITVNDDTMTRPGALTLLNLNRPNTSASNRSRESSISFYYSASEDPPLNGMPRHSMGPRPSTTSATTTFSTEPGVTDTITSDLHRPIAPTISLEPSEQLTQHGSESELSSEGDEESLTETDDECSDSELDSETDEPDGMTLDTEAVTAADTTADLIKKTKDDSTDAGDESEAELTIIKRFQRKVKDFVDGDHFTRGILVAILVNTLSMGVEYHQQPPTLTLILEYSNLFFTGLFALEMFLKILAEGPFGYLGDGFNVFDGGIVVLSIVEVVQGEGGGLSVLRTFRLLRILKLVRFMPALRYQLVVMLRTMDNVTVFFGLLVLFIFIFSLLGMVLFGGKFCNQPDGSRCSCQDLINPNVTCRCNRKNFDTFVMASLTVFQILTQEDWNMVLFNGMSQTTPWAALYFVLLMTFGNYVLFNLLVAILVEGFQESKEEERRQQDEELAKQEDEDDIVRKQEEELLLFKTPSQNYLPGNGGGGGSSRLEDGTDLCTCHLPYQMTNDRNRILSLPTVLMPYSGSAAGRTASGRSSLIGSYVAINPSATPPHITHTLATPQASPMMQLRGSPAALRPPGVGQDGRRNSSDSMSSRSWLSTQSQPQAPNGSGHLLAIPNPHFMSTLPPTTTRDNREPLPKIHESGRRFSMSIRSMKFMERNKIPIESDSDDDQVEVKQRRATLASQPENLRGIIDAAADHRHCNGGLAERHKAGSFSVNEDKKQSILHRHASFDQNDKEYWRSRLNSWSGRRPSFSPYCRVHGRRAMLEAYARDKFLKVSQELQEALDEEKHQEQCCLCCHQMFQRSCFTTRRDYALYLFHPKNKVRAFCLMLSEKKWFDFVVLFFIGLNCITLAMERPSIPPESRERLFLHIANYIFTVIFTIEMVIKVIARGCICGPETYFKDGWNIMDGILVIINLINILFDLFFVGSPKIFGVIRVLRLLRALRPLRVINRAPGVKLVVQTLISSLKPIGNIVLICCTFFIIFGILGVQLFKGMMHHCVGDGMPNNNITNRSDCEDAGMKWANQRYNFDNLGQALMSLFVLSSKDGWVSIMYQGIDAVGVDQQPIENYNEWRMVYFIAFLLLVGFFVLNMFVGVVVENFHKCKEEIEAEMEEKAAKKRELRKLKKQSSKQALIPRAKKVKSNLPYYAHYGPTRLFINNTVTSKYFDLAIAAVIGVNVITMAMEFYKMPDVLIYILRALNYFFTAVFTLEAAMKLLALGFKTFFKERWNQLDMFIVILSIGGIILEEFQALSLPINPTIIRVMRVLRIARVLKLLKMAKGIRSLLDTVGEALPQVGNLGSLFFLMFFIFAALGVELFGKLECSDEHPCDGLGEHAHFRTFGMAILTLFRIATGDNWNGIMKDTLRDDCNPETECTTNCCVSPIMAPIFFVVFVLMSQFVLVNVVVAVLMKHLEESNKKESDELKASGAAAAGLTTGTDTEFPKTDTEGEEKDMTDKDAETPVADMSDHLTVHRPTYKQISLPPNLESGSDGGNDRSNANDENNTPPNNLLYPHQDHNILAASLPELPYTMGGAPPINTLPPPYEEVAMVDFGGGPHIGSGIPNRYGTSLYIPRPRPRARHLPASAQSSSLLAPPGSSLQDMISFREPVTFPLRRKSPPVPKNGHYSAMGEDSKEGNSDGTKLIHRTRKLSSQSSVEGVELVHI